ncbi:FAD-dependent monooxygenase azaH [Colletotrichum sp. SAR11_59]|nr:FAD-dependent monooxygenase azaH [Colletotrichum sp. SAR11_59]
MAPIKKDFEIAIIGGGIAGVALAISLVKRNVPCTIYEKAHVFGEIGAGLGITPNATRAMKACDPVIYEVFDRVAQPDTLWTFFDGSDEKKDDEPIFTLGDAEAGIRGCHRAHFLDGMIRHLPKDVAKFNKQLDRVEEPYGPSGKLRMVFQDGSTAEADAIVGCDGIKSRTREIVVGSDHPSATCRFTHKHCYRGLIPMDEALEIIGKKRAMGSNLWRMKSVDRWGLFDLGDHPVPTFSRGRICLIGDAAHASTPHQGAGAGLCIEDAATLASLLADDRVEGRDDISAAFAAYDQCRRDRGHRLVEGSRRIGELYEGQTEVGKDFKAIENEVRTKAKDIWEFDINESIHHSLGDLEGRIFIVPGLYESIATFGPLIDELKKAGYPSIHVGTIVSGGTSSKREPRGLTIADDSQGIRTELEPFVDRCGSDGVILVLHSAGGFIGAGAMKGLTQSAYEDEAKRDRRKMGSLVLWWSWLILEKEEKGTQGPVDGMAFFNDMSADAAKPWIDEFVHHPAHGWGTKIEYAGWHDVPVDYIICERDQIIPMPMQETVAAGAEAKVYRLDAGHMAQLSRTKDLANLIVEAIRRMS